MSEADAGHPVVCLACGAQFLVPGLPAEAAPRAESVPGPGDTQVAPAVSPGPDVAGVRPPAPERPGPARPVGEPTGRPWAVVLVACAASILIGAVLATAVVLFVRRGGDTAPVYSQVDTGPVPRPAASAPVTQPSDQGVPAEDPATQPAPELALNQAGGQNEENVAAPAQDADPIPTEPTTGRQGISAASVPTEVSPASPTTTPTTTPTLAPAPATVAEATPPPPAPATTQPAAAVAAAPARPPVRPQPEPVVGITDEQIGESIQRGADWLLNQFNPQTLQLRDGGGGGAGGRSDPAHLCGLNALCVYALMQSGQAIHDTRLDPRGPTIKGMIDRMRRLPAGPGHPEVYARGIRATALAQFDRPEDRGVLQADLKYLLDGHGQGAYTYQAMRMGGSRYNSQSRRDGPWDNSNSQYGLLGVWSAAEAGEEVPSAYWKVVENHWVECQAANGQWGYRHGGENGTLSMTAAGTASLFVAQEYLDRARYGAKVGRDPFSPSLARALRWFETGDNAVTLYGGWPGYTLYGIERVGLASGFKYFGTHDWYRELAEQVVRRQRGNGSWGDGGRGGEPLVETAYALLFLARGRHPVVMNKLRFEGYWANRPRDAANLARYAGQQLERPLNWQVVPIDRPYQDWLDSPILYLASHRAIDIHQRQIEQIRQYVEAGGILFTHADGDAPAFNSWAEALAAKLFPKYELQDLPAGHPVYDVVYKIEPAPKLRAVSNGVRLLMVHSPTDIAKAWQLRDEQKGGGKSVFQLGVNLFVYAAGKRELRNRLSSPYVSDPGKPLNGMIKVARIEYAGNWDPEPGAWRRYARLFQRQTGTALDVQPVKWKDLRPHAAPFAHLTGTAAYHPTDEELAALRRYVEAGGVLLVDAAGGSRPFAESIDSALAKSLPSGQLLPLPPDHPLFRPGPPDSGLADTADPKLRPYAAELLGRSAGPLQGFAAGDGQVLFTPLDLTSGLLGTQTWAIPGYDPDYAQALLQNALLWALDRQPSQATPPTLGQVR